MVVTNSWLCCLSTSLNWNLGQNTFFRYAVLPAQDRWFRDFGTGRQGTCRCIAGFLYGCLVFSLHFSSICFRVQRISRMWLWSWNRKKKNCLQGALLFMTLECSGRQEGDEKVTGLHVSRLVRFFVRSSGSNEGGSFLLHLDHIRFVREGSFLSHARLSTGLISSTVFGV